MSSKSKEDSGKDSAAVRCGAPLAQIISNNQTLNILHDFENPSRLASHAIRIQFIQLIHSNADKTCFTLIPAG